MSRHFERVTVVERDHLPRVAEHRSGVPQSHHVHALLLRGSRELERTFPGIADELIAAGASRMDLGGELAYCSEFGWVPPVGVGITPMVLSRILLESVVRARALSDVANLHLLEGTRLTGLVTERNGDHLRVVGVKTNHPEHRELRGDLVVDASGRSSKCLAFLAADGVAEPPIEMVDAHSGYASRFYELAPDENRWWRGMLIEGKAPTRRRWGLLMPIEHGRCVVTLGGVNGEYPPADEPGFMEYLNSLPTRALAREIARAKPLSKIHAHRSLYNRARHFERWTERVGGFVTLGDAAVAFNATYGQGMSMAATAANALGDTLGTYPDADAFALTQRFHKAQWAHLKTAWQIASGADLEWPGTEGKRPFAFGLKLALAATVVRASHELPQIKRLYAPIYQLVGSPWTLVRPDLVALVAYAGLRRSLGRPLVRLPPIDCPTFAQDHLPPLQEQAPLHASLQPRA
ncbi:MAG: hypothetical protein OXU20_41795 [Myxococcales bacterium]|nr:hypothetical protein [Myxococcales bacterium]MDD9970253.1 hypothetical protein [Myxococcales bacterium]